MEAQDFMAYKVLRREYGLSFGSDPRYVTSHDQLKWCWSTFNDYLRCVDKLGADAPRCQYTYQKAHALCPLAYIEKWEDQVANGNFPGYVPGKPTQIVVAVDYSKKGHKEESH